jgi:hypothetical protein
MIIGGSDNNYYDGADNNHHHVCGEGDHIVMAMIIKID